MRKKAAKGDLVEEYTGSLTAKGMRQHFRRYNRQSKARMDGAIEQLRARSHHSRYAEALRSLITAAPHQIPVLFPLGQHKFGDLLLIGEPFKAIPFESELRWTAIWLSARGPALSAFRRSASKISELVGAERIDEALTVLRQYRAKVGYTLWSMELEFALIQLRSGTAAQKELLARLRKQAPPNSVAGFIAYLISDRNDDSLSYDSFYSRCKENIPRMSVDHWLQDYLLYRALQHYDQTPTALATNLRNERLSSIIDLYETFVETCVTICSTHELRRYRVDVLAALDELVDVEDPRLYKIRLYAGGDWDTRLQLASEEQSTWADLHPFLLYRGTPAPQESGGTQRKTIRSDLQEVWDKGSGADKSVARLLKFGVNLKSLDIGIAIASHAERQSSKTGPLMLIAAGAPFILSGVSLAEVYGGPVDFSRKLLSDYVSRQTSDSQQASRALEIADGGAADLTGLPELAKLWLANLCLLTGRYDVARKCADELRGAGPRWVREATKHQFVSAYTRGDLATACEVLAAALVQDRALSVELPITEMFAGKKWRDFSALDPIQVGIAAHYAFDAPPASPVGYIMSSSCRSALRNGHRARLDASPSEAPQPRNHAQFVLFFGEAWDEDALSRTGAFDTTHEVRVERLNVVRRLLDWDPARQEEYVEVIKALTLDETLWRGVKHINETRVFVNEPAITRWAERELFEEHARWLELVKTENTAEQFTEAKLLEYLSAPIDAHSGVARLERLTESDAELINIVNRLLHRFLTDPTDGLNCYLSLRVRHGSLLRTLFGPAEGIDLLLPEGDGTEESTTKVREMSAASWFDVERVHKALCRFSRDLRKLGDDLVKERIQLLSESHPKGIFRAPLQLSYLIDRIDKVARHDFDLLIELCYAFFWNALAKSLEDARTLLSTEIKEGINNVFTALLEDLSVTRTVSASFIASIKQAATMTSAQCDIAAGWFQLPNRRDIQTFSVDQAIEIATSVAQKIFAGFEPELDRTGNCEDLPLSGIGLNTIFDCLFVIFDNVWQRSGTGRTPRIRLDISLDGDVLRLRAESAVSEEVSAELRAGRLEEIHNRIAGPNQEGLVPIEGGSGLAKLKRLTRSVPKDPDRPPFEFGLKDSRTWFVSVGMKLHKNESDAFYVY